jgi:hypothetical protein
MIDLLSTAIITAYTWVGKTGVVGWWKNHVAIQQANYQTQQSQIQAAYFLCIKKDKCDDLEAWAKPDLKSKKGVIPTQAPTVTVSPVSTPSTEASP